MAKALWEQPITKNDDWGGGDFSGGAPVSGKYVQQYIKETLNKKFGYLYYNKDARKYYVFADQEDYNKWSVNQSLNADLVLSTFDAPAPATIKTKTLPLVSPESVTMLYGTDIPPIVFHYYIEDNSGNAVREDVIMRITATSNSSSKSEVITIKADSTYKMKESEYAAADTTNKYGYNESNTNPIGIRYEYARLNRLLTTADNYNIVITLTGVTTQVSTMLTYEYRLVDLSLTTDFNYLSPISSNADEIIINNLEVNGAESFSKFIVLKIDGHELTQNSTQLGIDRNRLISSRDNLGDEASIKKQLEIFMVDKDKKPLKWQLSESDPMYAQLNGKEIFGPGKHTLQLSTYIKLSLDNDDIISSKYLYYNFVVAADSGEYTYLLYTSELNEEFDTSKPIQLAGTQYSQIEYSIGVYTTLNREVPIKYVYEAQQLDNDGNPIVVNGENLMEVVNEFIHKVRNGNLDNNRYTLRNSGLLKLTISAYSSLDADGNPVGDAVDRINVEITSNVMPGVTIAETTTNNIFKYSAENRSNNDPDHETWPNVSKGYGTQYPLAGVLNKVNFNDINGWVNDALVLRNGATITFPFNLFNMPIAGDKEIAKTGFTFEIDFETINVQNDNAVIMDFAERDEDGYITTNSHITIYATSAEMESMNGSIIKTNFKEAERIKLAFIVNPLKDTENNQYDPNNTKSDDNPNTLFIMVNGVLDRVVKYGTGREGSDSFMWGGSNVANSFTIGNTDGDAGVKIYSIRIYNKALTLDEEFMNYMNDQTGDELINVFDKNNIIGTNSIDLDKVKAMIPTMIMYGDYVSFGSFDATRKKDNTFAEIQYFDPKNNDLNFYARQCWVSCQGTSSMSYPVKNLRLYFGKTTNSKTFQIINQIEKGETVQAITDELKWEKPEFETEFWPYSEYGSANEEKVYEWADEHLPYSTNKKADGPDGSAILVNGDYATAIHDGYHKIGANRTIAGKITLIKNYLGLKDMDPTNIDPSNLTIGEKGVELFMVDTTKSPLFVKDAFDNKYIVYSTSGMEGYIGTGTSADTATYGTQYYYDKDDDITEIKYDIFKKLDNTELSNMSDEELTTLLSKNDIFISAYRPLLPTGMSLDSAAYTKLIDELRLSGVKIYYAAGKNANGGVKYKAYKGNLNAAIDNTKSPLYDENGTHTWHHELFFSLGSNWRQYDDHSNTFGYGTHHVSGWTDRWTLKADYAESSMCHNSGIGRLWGNAMYNVNVNGKTMCRTNAQEFVAKETNAIDIRTSCDGKPIVMFYQQILRFSENGRPVYDTPKFAGLYNIMTDKSSTKLFGFEDITNVAGEKWTKVNKQYNSKYTECWECLNNGSGIIKGLVTSFDKKENGKTAGDNSKKSKLGDGRPLWDTYEARWPDTGQERHAYNPEDNPLGNNWADDVYGVDSKNLEGFLRWVNFCKDAIDYTIGANGEMKGYEQNIYQLLDSYTALETWNIYNAQKAIYESSTATNAEKAEAEEQMKIYTLYKKWNTSGNDNYSAIGEDYDYIGTVDGKDQVMTAKVEWSTAEGAEWYIRNYSIDMEIVNKSINPAKIGHKVYVTGIKSFDAEFRCTDAAGNYNEEEANNYLVDTYVWPSGDGNYIYYDNYGEEKKVTAAAIDLNTDNEHTVTLSSGSEPVSCQNITYMQYFSATKRDHLDLEKVAAYYIYLLRFGGVDQVVKNSMMTSEDGKHWYFINYDNDTTLGVRNDGYLIYNWDMDRNTYDASLPGYAFAGAQSVLWNCLEMDQEFMDLVQTIDNAMSKQGLLSAEAVLTWFNERQEGVWCQRLYNEQEKVKYLSTVKKDFTTDKYLGFMQGTRHSHRNWWVNHRWELYDAKWSSGVYSLKQMSFIYTLSASDTNPVDMMIITAASKYYFTMIRNTALSYSDWFKELDRNKTGVYTIRQANSVGDPIFFYGPQKLKVLNLRPTANSISRISLAEAYTVTQGDGTQKTSNWVDEDGSMMTKLLIGFNDTDPSATAVDISGLNKLYSLEEIDIRGMKKLNGGVPTISELSNLHRWRAKNSNATSFQPAKGVTLYEVSLGSDTATLVLDGVEFKKDENAYVEYQTNAVSGNTSIGASLGTTYGDILPIYDKLDSYKYCKSYKYNEDKAEYELINNFRVVDEENDIYEGDYVFEYTPTSKLKNITFNNVKGLDTFAFLTDLKETLQKTAGVDAKTYNVRITGMEWVLADDEEKTAVEKLIDMYDTFNYKDNEGNEYFDGKVFINRALTQDEYDALVAKFGADVFKPTNNLVINCKEGTLMNVIGGKKTENILVDGQQETVYELVQGQSLKIMASIFPISESNNYVYVMKRNNTWATGPAITNTTSKGTEVYTMANGDIVYATLTNKDSAATFYADPTVTGTAGGLGDGQYFRIDVCRYRANGTINVDDTVDGATTFIKVIRRVVPTRNSDFVVVDNSREVSEEGTALANMSAISDNDVHTFTLKYRDNVTGVNVGIKSVSVSFNDSEPQYTYVRTLEDNSTVTAAEIKQTDGKYVEIDNANQTCTFNIEHNIAQFVTAERQTLKVYVKIELDTEDIQPFEKTLEYRIDCIYANEMTISDINGSTPILINQSDPIVIKDLGTYKYKIGFDNDHNINYTIDFIDKITASDWSASIDGDELTIHVGIQKATSISRSLRLKATPDEECIVPGYIEELQLSRSLEIIISYPDYIDMTCTDLLMTDNEKQHVNSNIKSFGNSFDLNITNNTTLSNVDLVLTPKTLLGENYDVTMSCSIILDSIMIGNASRSVGEIVYNTTTEKFDGVTASGDEYIGNYISFEGVDPIQFTPIYEEVVLDGAPYLTLTKIRVNSAAVADQNYSYDVKINCQVRYDNDNTTINEDGSPLFNFRTLSGQTTNIIEFSMTLLRSKCVATMYKHLNTIDNDPVENGYRFYAVDKLNRFFAIDAVKNTSTEGDAYIITPKFTSEDVPVGDIIGCGFVKSDGSYKRPIFVSFTTFVGHSIGNPNATVTQYNLGTNEADKPERLALKTAATDKTLYNGAFITEKFAEISDNYGTLFEKVWNTESAIKLYVPSFKEMSEIVNTLSVNADTAAASEQTIALDCAMRYLATESFATGRKNYANESMYTDIASIKSIMATTFVEFTKFLCLENHTTSADANLITSTNYWPVGTNYTQYEICVWRRRFMYNTADTPKYNFEDKDITKYGGQYDRNNVAMLFVNVK